MTPFGNFDLEQTMRGRMVDLPTFDAYNVQYQPPTSALHYDYESIQVSPRSVVYNRTFMHDSLTPGGDGGPSFGSNHNQPPVYRSTTSACAVQSPCFWQNGIAPGGSLEPTGCAATTETSMVEFPTSMVQGRGDYLLRHEPHIRSSIITPPRHSDPFQMSAYVVHEVDSLAATQTPPEEAYVPSQLFPSFRHTTIPQPSVPSIRAILNPATIHLAAHQPVPPECQSTYSTLAGNIEFLEKLRLESASRYPSPCGASSSPAESQSQPLATTLSASNKRQRSPSSTSPCRARPENGTKRVSFLDERGTQGSLSGTADPSPDVPDTRIPTQLMFMDGDSGRGVGGSSSVKRARKEDPSTSTSSRLLVPSSHPPPPPSSPAMVSEPTSGVSAVAIEDAPSATKYPKNVKEPRKPSLACLFCRERKIGCGRPPEGSEDMTCNQCARRNFVCVYMAEKPARVRRRPAKANLPTA